MGKPRLPRLPRLPPLNRISKRKQRPKKTQNRPDILRANDENRRQPQKPIGKQAPPTPNRRLATATRNPERKQETNLGRLTTVTDKKDTLEDKAESLVDMAGDSVKRMDRLINRTDCLIKRMDCLVNRMDAMAVQLERIERKLDILFYTIIGLTVVQLGTMAIAFWLVYAKLAERLN